MKSFKKCVIGALLFSMVLMTAACRNRDKNTGDTNDKNQRQEECNDKLPEYVYIKFSWSKVKLHFLIVL